MPELDSLTAAVAMGGVTTAIVAMGGIKIIPNATKWAVNKIAGFFR